MRIFQVDAFTDKAFLGNPAAVCILTEPAGDEWLQAVAKEMNLSETAFVLPAGEGYNLRWFTPTVEVDLCGHATLASAHILWEQGYLDKTQPAKFFTRSGCLTAGWQNGWIELNFPAIPPRAAAPAPGMLEALAINPTYVGVNSFDYLLEVEAAEIVKRLEPDFAALSKISARGVIVTSLADNSDFDFISRFFAPGYGINEDPVTGSAHCCLGPYWQGKLGKSSFYAYQASQRGGELKVRVDGERVYLGGQAVTVLTGELCQKG